MKADNC